MHCFYQGVVIFFFSYKDVNHIQKLSDVYSTVGRTVSQLMVFDCYQLKSWLSVTTLYYQVNHNPLISKEEYFDHPFRPLPNLFFLDPAIRLHTWWIETRTCERKDFMSQIIGHYIMIISIICSCHMCSTDSVLYPPQEIFI